MNRVGVARSALVAIVLLAIGGCASNLIEVRKGSDRVAVAEPGAVSSCKLLGKSRVTVVTQVGFFSRSLDDVDADLLQLARNDAVDMSGDTVVPGEREGVGRRTFLIYKCGK